MKKQLFAALILILALLCNMPTSHGQSADPQATPTMTPTRTPTATPTMTPTPGPLYNLGVSVLYTNSGNGVGAGLTVYGYDDNNGIYDAVTDVNSHVNFQLEAGHYRFHLSFWNAYGWWDCEKEHYLNESSAKEILVYCRRPFLVFVPVAAQHAAVTAN